MGQFMGGLTDHGKEVSKCDGKLAESSRQSPAAVCRDDRGARAEADRPVGGCCNKPGEKEEAGEPKNSNLGNRKKEGVTG